MIIQFIVIATTTLILNTSCRGQSPELVGEDAPREERGRALTPVAPQVAPAIRAEELPRPRGVTSRRGSLIGAATPSTRMGREEGTEGGEEGAARGGGTPAETAAPVATNPTEMIPTTMNPAVQGALRTAFRGGAFVTNTLQSPIPAVVSLSYCMLGTAQVTERLFRPLAYFGGAAALTAFTLAGTVDHVPFLQSDFSHVGFWIAGITGGVSIIRMGAPKLVTDLQNWLRDLEIQRQERQGGGEPGGEVDPESGGALPPIDPSRLEGTVVGAVAPGI